MVGSFTQVFFFHIWDEAHMVVNGSFSGPNGMWKSPGKTMVTLGDLVVCRGQGLFQTQNW